MGTFNDIVSAIVHHANPAAAPAADASAPEKHASPAPAQAAPAAASINSLDVAAVLDKLVAEKHERLDWHHLIVDLLKILSLDSSLSARKYLATELHYAGDMNDSAGMNIWLHRQVMTELAKNRGKVPDDLKH